MIGNGAQAYSQQLWGLFGTCGSDSKSSEGAMRISERFMTSYFV